MAASAVYSYWCSHELLLVLVTQILFFHSCRTQDQIELRVAYITTDGGQYVSNGSIPAVTLALNEVNEVFSGRFELQMNTTSILCSRTDSLESYFDAVKSEGAPLIAVLGCGCSPATEPVAEISHYQNLIHMSYASSSPILSDRSRFPYFWRTYPSDSSVTAAVLAVMKEYKWKRLKILTQEEILFIETTQNITEELRGNDIVVDQTGTLILRTNRKFNDSSVEMLFTAEIRVFMLNMYEQQARRILCQAAKLDDSDIERYVSGYVWILHGWYQQRWWTAEVANDDTVDCSDEELEVLLKRSISILQIPAADNLTAPTDVQLTAEEFRNAYENNLGANRSEPSAALAYDAVWALALSLNESGINSNSTPAELMLSMQAVLSADFSFVGVSGVVQFDGNGSRLPHDTRILQYRNDGGCLSDGNTELQPLPVAIVSERNNNFTYICGLEDCCESRTVWPDGVPVDGTSSRELTTITTPVFVIYTILASIGIIFAIVCLIFNIVFREKKIVKLTSPNLNYVVLLGAFFLYTSIYFYVIPTTDEFTSTLFCHIRAWLQPGGYLICYGTIMLKIWRVYYIFHNPSAKVKRKIPKDWMLFLGILALVGLLVMTMIWVPIFDDYKATEVEDKESGDERDGNKVLVEKYNLVCQGRRSYIWIFLLFFYIIVTQIVAVYLAFRTRKIKIKALNDAKYLAFIIYISTVIVTIMIIGAVALRNYINADAAVFSTVVFLFSTCILGLLFVPKMVILYKDPNGEFIFNRSMSQVAGTMTAMSLNDSERERLRDLEIHCRDIEARLGKHEHVQPFRTLSKTRLVSSSIDFSNSIQLAHTSSIAKPPLNNVDTISAPGALRPSTPPSNGYSSAGDVESAVQKESPEISNSVV